MEWWVNLILWGTVLWIPILMYVQTVNDAKAGTLTYCDNCSHIVYLD